MIYLTHHMALESANRYSHHPALIDRDSQLDFEPAVQRAAAIAASLRDHGIKKGDRVAVFLKPEIELPLAILGISMAGGVFVPLHHGLFPDQVAHILSDSSATALITAGSMAENLDAVLHRAPSVRFIVASEPSQDRLNGIPVFDLHGCFELHSKLPVDSCIEKDLAAIIYTSGSTGLPKGVMLSHANILAGANIVAEYLSISHDDRILAALPFSFDAGLNQLMTALLKGATTVMCQFTFAREIVRSLVNHEITGLAGVPSLWGLLAQPSSGLSRQSLPQLRYITNTGGALPLNVLQDLRIALPSTQIYLMYGLTEAFRSTFLPPDQLDQRPTSIGKAIPNTEILVINDEGEQCAPGEIGELVHRGPTVSMGYWGHPELTEKILKSHPFPPRGQAVPETVCYSGDLVTCDGEGYLYFSGRRDNLIKSAGFRISPTEVEAVLCDAAPVRQAAVVGIPDPVMGQVLVAFAVIEERAQQVSSSDVIANCAARLPRHMVPKHVRFLSGLPLTASGKVDYPALQKLANAADEVEDTSEKGWKHDLAEA